MERYRRLCIWGRGHLSWARPFTQAMGSKQEYAALCGGEGVPLEETLASVVIDFCDRPYLVYNADIPPGRMRDVRCRTYWKHFFLGFASHSRATLHLQLALWP